jgi:hypothetical protein
VDDGFAVLPQRSEPCGVWGLDSYLTLDDSLSDALGIGRAINEPH